MTNGKDLAYPIFDNDGNGLNGEFGLTKRELFAAMAMQGILSNAAYSEEFKVYDWGVDGKRIAHNALHCADALINALNKEQ